MGMVQDEENTSFNHYAVEVVQLIGLQNSLLQLVYWSRLSDNDDAERTPFHFDTCERLKTWVFNYILVTFYHVPYIY